MVEPHKILWSERDVGQKMSLILAGLFLFGSTVFMIFAGVRAVEEGDWWMAAGPLGWILLSIDLLARWRRRNAR